MNSRFLLLGASAIAALAFVACGGDDDDDDAGSNDEPRAEATKSNDDNATSTSGGSSGGSNSQATPTTGSGGGSVSGSGADDLKKIVRDLRNKTFQVTYDITVTEGSEETKGTMVLAQKPPTYVTSFALDGINFTLISDGKDDITCTSFAANTGTCTKSATQAQSNAIFDFEELLASVETDVKVTNAKGQKIANRDAACFDVEQGGETAFMCFDKKDGYLLLVESKSADGTYTLKANDAKNSVDQKLLEPPYPVE